MASKNKILMVDDEQDWRTIVRLTLQTSGFDMTVTEDGKLGFEALKKSRPDLILLDIMMPKMNGIEFSRRMIDELKMTDVPVIIISAVNEKSKIIQEFFSLDLEHKHFLQKPVATADLKAKVIEILGSPSAAAAQAVQAEAAKAAAESPAKPVKKPMSLKGPSMRILVVDDEEDIRKILKTALSIHHTVETAENGMLALEAIERFAPDFMICDINMPVMNGLEMVEALRRHPRFGSIPVFFLTGETDANLPRKTFDVGGNLYLKKPLDPIRLLNMIDYFVKETGLKPGEKPSGAPAAPKPGQAAPGASKVRVLTVDYNAETNALLRRLIGEDRQGRWETMWAEDARTALGNLERWESDVIFYNPRNPIYDGIAFSQLLKFRKLAARTTLVFVGSEFFDADIEYSRKSLGHGVIRTDQDEQTVKKALVAMIEAARKNLAPKRHSMSEIEAENSRHQDQLKAKRNQMERERKAWQDKFGKIQTFIDNDRKL